MYKNIMVPMDGSELAECVLPHVETIAKTSKASVELVQVIEPLEIPTRGGIALTADDIKQIESHIKNEAESYLNKISDRLKKKKLTVQSTLLWGKVATSLVDHAKSTNSDLIVMATHGRSGVSRWVLGSIADKVLHSSHIPVLLVRAPGNAPKT